MSTGYTETVCAGKHNYTSLAIPLAFYRRENMPMGYGKNIARLRKGQKLTQAGLAEIVGVEQPTVQRWESEKREPDYEALTSLAEALGVEPGAFFTEDLSVPEGPKLFVKGEVRAGHWVEAYEWPEDNWTTFTGRPGVIAKPEHRFGLRVIGDSMNRKYPDGSIVECISLFGHAEAHVGKRVVVVRKRDDQMYEATVKLLVEQDGELWAVPESTNPAFQPIRLAAPEPGILETRIAAIVVRAIIDED
jgi:transcriptional regulator with XRE-family HTH domain